MKDITLGCYTDIYQGCDAAPDSQDFRYGDWLVDSPAYNVRRAWGPKRIIETGAMRQISVGAMRDLRPRIAIQKILHSNPNQVEDCIGSLSPSPCQLLRFHWLHITILMMPDLVHFLIDSDWSQANLVTR